MRTLENEVKRVCHAFNNNTSLLLMDPHRIVQTHTLRKLLWRFDRAGRCRSRPPQRGRVPYRPITSYHIVRAGSNKKVPESAYTAPGIHGHPCQRFTAVVRAREANESPPPRKMDHHEQPDRDVPCLACPQRSCELHGSSSSSEGTTWCRSSHARMCTCITTLQAA